MESFLPVFIQIVIALGLAGLIMAITHVIGQRTQRNFIGNSPYECGMLPEGKTHTRFAVKFYVTAMLFILLDIEAVFLFPWAITFRDLLMANIPIMLPVLFFFLVLVVGLVFEIRRGALDWEK